MSYVTDNLLANEQIEQVAELHWSNYISVAILGIAASISVWLCLAVAALPDVTAGLRLYIVTAFFIVWSGYSFWNLLLSEMFMTNLRVVRKTGLLQQTIKEIGISHIDSVEVRQSVLGRMFNYGTVCFCGFGVSKNVMFGADMHFSKNRMIRLKFKRVKYPQSIKLQTEILMAMMCR